MKKITSSITVFIAVFNAEKYIKETIESVLNQTYKNFELLIIDDGSTDGSLEVISKYNDPRIRFLCNSTNKGICYTRQRGLEEASGKYIAILDADDIMIPNRLELQYSFLEENLNYALCGSNAYFIDNNSKPVSHSYTTEKNKNLIKINLLLANQFINSSIMFRTETIKMIGGYIKKTCEDYDLFVRVAEKYETTNLDEKLVKYRIHNESDSRIRSKTYDIFIEEIVNYQYSRLLNSKKLNYIPILLFYKDYNKVNSADINLFFKELYENNKVKNIYDPQFFYSVFNQIWIEIILTKKSFKQMWLFVFNCNFIGLKLNFNQKIKILKRLLNPF